ncbi:MAG TPA: hypothetical protein VG500_20410 [Gemmatimonadales bacterium]|nr:hypothetical protein [Gemmatimonadales bacterium]
MIALLLLLVLTGTAAAQSPGANGPVRGDAFAIGLSGWPPDSFCAGPMSAAMQQVPPKEVLRRIHQAARCGVRLVLVPPRRMLTADGRPDGAFLVEAAKRVIDRYADELPPDTLRKYRATILGFNLADDYGCKRCWGGQAITQAEIAQWAGYARARLPGVPLGVRVIPEWVAKDPALASLLDYAWAQYHTKKGDAKSYFDEAAATADQLGLRVIMGVNVHDCYGVGTDPCSSEDLVRYGRMALSHPASCAFINWRYDEKTWRRSDMRGVWEELVAMAKKRGAQECRRSG